MSKIIICKNGEQIIVDDEFEIPRTPYIVKGYARFWDGKREWKLHRFITNAPYGLDVDHINMNKLDNRSSNLRVCTRSQNRMNTLPRINNRYNHKGVYFYKAKNKWCAFIWVNGKNKHLGYFGTKEEAIKKRISKENEYRGEYAVVKGNK